MGVDRVEMIGGIDVADVLIVGAGASGGVVARHLAEAGLKVVVLEQGHWMSTYSFVGKQPEFELLASLAWNPDPNVRSGSEDYPVVQQSSATTIGMFNGVGGSTILYAGVWSRARPSDFRVRSIDGVGDDWPLTYEELVPYYEAVERELGVSGLSGNPAYPPGFEPPLPPFPLNRASRKLGEGMNRLGWHWWPGYNAIASTDYGRLKQCERLGICVLGCPVGAKASTDITHFPAAIEAGAKVVTGARVARILLDGRGLAKGAVYYLDGKECFQSASTVVLAANGIGTPRLLLMSSSSQFPDGLANSSGLVGRRFMTHPYGTVAGTYEDVIDEGFGPVGEAIQSMEFYETDQARGFVRGSKWHVLPPGGRPLRMIDRLSKEEGVSPDGFWGARFVERLDESVGHTIEWAVMPDDLPEDSNFVALDDQVTDSDGLPAPRVHYQLSENTRRIVEFNLQRALEAHEASGATKAWITGRSNPSWHNMGTAKMGIDPATSVVDAFGRAHDVKNLFIVDGSLFPTATAVPPTATICALAKRTAEHIVSSQSVVSR